MWVSPPTTFTLPGARVGGPFNPNLSPNREKRSPSRCFNRSPNQNQGTLPGEDDKPELIRRSGGAANRSLPRLRKECSHVCSSAGAERRRAFLQVPESQCKRFCLESFCCILLLSCSIPHFSSSLFFESTIAISWWMRLLQVAAPTPTTSPLLAQLHPHWLKSSPCRSKSAKRWERKVCSRRTHRRGSRTSCPRVPRSHLPSAPPQGTWSLRPQLQGAREPLLSTLRP